MQPVKINWFFLILNIVLIIFIIFIVIDKGSINTSNEIVYKTGYLQCVVDTQKDSFNPFLSSYYLNSEADISFIRFKLKLNEYPYLIDSLYLNKNNIYEQLLKVNNAY